MNLFIVYPHYPHHLTPFLIQFWYNDNRLQKLFTRKQQILQDKVFRCINIAFSYRKNEKVK